MNKPVLSMRQMREAIRDMSFNQLVGIRLVRIHKDGVTIDCKLRPELMNAHGVLHGGVTATMADAAVGIAITTRMGRPAATTVEMKLNYMRPVTGGKITARAYLLRMGSTLCIGRVDLFNDARELVAAALVTYMLIKTTPSAPTESSGRPQPEALVRTAASQKRRRAQIGTDGA